MKKILKGILLLSVIALVYNYFIKADAEVVYGINVEGIQIDPIDMHLHTGTWEALTEPYKERYSERVPKAFRFLISSLLSSGLKTEGLLKQIDNAGIRRAGIFAVYSPDTTGIASNEFLYEQIKDNYSQQDVERFSSLAYLFTLGLGVKNLSVIKSMSDRGVGFFETYFQISDTDPDEIKIAIDKFSEIIGSYILEDL